MPEYYRAFAFRDLLNKWDEHLVLEAEKQAIENHLDQNQCIIFFQNGDDFFGGPEESRMIFAKLKDDDDKSWRDEAQFMGLNLIQSLMGQPKQQVFSFKDLPNIKILDRDNLIDQMIKKGKNKKK